MQPDNQNTPLQPVHRLPQISVKKIVVIIVAVIVIAAVVVFVILFAKGNIYFGFKQPSEKIIINKPGQKTVVYTVVCGPDVVDQFNKLYFPMDSTDKDILDKIVDSASVQAGYIEDPTCQAISFWRSFQDGDKSSALKFLKNLENLNAKGLYPNNNLQNMYSPQVMAILINQMK